MLELPEAARAFALTAHGAQRYGAHPYSVHLDAVVRVLRRHGVDAPEALAAGYLHDVLEDTPTTPEALGERFGAAVLTAVRFCSDEAGQTRAERKRATYARMGRDLDAQPPWAALAAQVKVADRCANVAACLADGSPKLALYAAEQAAFRAAVRRPGLCDALWATLDALLA